MKQQRINQFNHWPQAQEFDAEQKFKSRIAGIELQELFFPYTLPSSNEKDLHVCVSYLLDALDSLPLRPDHAFDWAWRGFEYLSLQAMGSQGNITNGLRSTVCPALDAFFTSEVDAGNAFFELTERIPFQTCEYLLKRINESAPYTFPPGQHPAISSYAKRMLFANGNPPVVSTSIQQTLDFLSKKYVLQKTSDRRNGASLLRRIIRGEQVNLGTESVKLTKSEVLLLLVSGLGYAFRNDRSHAKSIAPFRSSAAKVTTYAHCWFMFLLFYEITLALLHTASSPVVLTGPIANNFRANNEAFVRIFGDYLNA